MNPLLSQFVPEARDLVASAGDALLTLEKEPGDAEVINTLFRALHTLKGSSGIFDVAPLTRAVHAAEDLLGCVRTGSVVLTAPMVDDLFGCLDSVSGWLDQLEAEERLSLAAGETAEDHARRLRAHIGGVGGDDGRTAGAPTVLEDYSWLSRLPEEERMAAMRDILADGVPLVAVCYEPDDSCFFNGDDPLQIVKNAPGRRSLVVENRADWPPLDRLDPFRCNLRLLLLAALDEEEACDVFAYVFDQVKVGVVEPQMLAVPTGERVGGDVYADFGAEASRLIGGRSWEALAEAAEKLQALGDGTLWENSALRWLACLARWKRDGLPVPSCWLRELTRALAENDEPVLNGSRPDGEAEADRPADAEPAADGPEPPLDLPPAVARILAAQRELLSTAGGEESVADGVLRSAARVVRNALSATGNRQAVAALERSLEGREGSDRLAALDGFIAGLVKPPGGAAENAGARPASRSGEEPSAGRRPSTLRVDQSRVDGMMNLVAELVVAKNAMPYLARRAEEVFGTRELAREIKEHYGVVHRIVQDLQSTVMSVRMLPMSQIFQRFPRIVRDLSRKLDKEVELVMEGEETEADKNVVENLADPLIHLIRNSIDHGLESAGERVAAGKPETGMVKLAARHENDSVVIEVSDDGRGIDPDVVRRKAVEKGLMDETRANALSDEEAVTLVFTAGFSTAGEVSEVSGRGVGMDVVRDSVDRAGGRIAISSRKGEGTLVRLWLPLNLAVSRVMTVECAGGLYGVPISLVVETVRVPAARLHTVAGREAVVLRDSVIPVVRLARLLDRPQEGDGEEVAILVMRIRGAMTGLVVDEFRGGMELIAKPMEGVLGSVPGFSSVATLGDGRVLLILHLEELV